MRLDNYLSIGIRFDSVNLLVWSGNREQGTGSREQGTGNREQGTGNREQGTGNRKDRIDTY
ncbi:hypothetical protein OA07_11145 [Aphanizomenon flos-aquae 2012/KM1/D3]|nr:hypothetical protein OA07_11145 [Aphanizomenon flos-aquae 2012/KM1/D3]